MVCNIDLSCAEKWGKNIQTAGYNGARTVFKVLRAIQGHLKYIELVLMKAEDLSNFSNLSLNFSFYVFAQKIWQLSIVCEAMAAAGGAAIRQHSDYVV